MERILSLFCSALCLSSDQYDLLEQDISGYDTDTFQCDEKKPICTNCSQHSIECDFSSPPVLPSQGSAASSPPTRRYRFKQSKYQPLAVPSPSDSNQSPDSTSTGVQCDLSASHHASGGISFADLELFHQFITATYITFGDVTEKHRAIWQVHVPRWGISFPSIHHLNLAIAALHLAHENPDRRDEYVAKADSHFTFGVRSVTNILSKLDSDNCQMVYLSAVLICFIYFARGPRRGEYLVFSETGQSEWLVLMRGVRFILFSKPQEVFSGILDPGEQEKPKMTPALETELLEQKVHLAAARQFLEESVPESERELYVSGMEKLMVSFEEMHNVRSIKGDGACLMPAVIGWIYRLPDTFVQRLEDKDSFALVILAYWSVMLKYMTPTWFMEGWDVHVISGIRNSLRVDYHQWIEWPVRTICGA
ncbi:putative C6 finger domain protein [Aspergillus steynii IBT 23096]|uniref:Putative C6 finger domain protein n=1 Tax=Aspergillus steynii IBT 23096 TaxID=1392250 RepID=A0A2I2FWV6_9EURO|nr:putative C6 finger domain protein [Aspergillus steynii IBT 23096]PLB45046.1 putative C6 finger domain protein [Aspergillus steynii IBT 23096]